MASTDVALQQFRRSIASISIFSFASNSLLLIVPLYMLQVYDRVLPSHSTETLIYLTLIACFALVVLALVDVVRSVLAHRAAARLDIALSDLTVRTTVHLGSATGGSAQPVRDVAALRGLLSSKVVFGLLDLPFAPLFIGLTYLIHPSLFLITMLGVVVLFAIAVANQMASARAAKRQASKSLDSVQRAEYLARNADSVLAMGMLTNVVNRWGKDHAAALAAADGAARVNAWFSGISRALRLALQIAILGYGAHLVLAGEMTAGMIFASSLISGKGLQPIDQTIGAWPQLVGGWQGWQRIKKFLANARPIKPQTELPAPNGILEVSNIHFANPADPARPPILQRISFALKAGESLAILGPSGAGKSTLARILVGATLPKAGTVRIDGHDIANWPAEALGTHVGYLAQETELIPGTIAENISRFNPNASGESVVAAASLAHAHELIQRLPQGYDTPIGAAERGVRLSGGERQRIGLARAFYGSPRLLILDEPNANLDLSGEEALLQALGEARRSGITVVIITQRESVLSSVDHILRMANGAVLEMGSREEMLTKYARGGARTQTTTSAAPSAPAAGGFSASSHFQKPLRVAAGDKQ